MKQLIAAAILAFSLANVSAPYNLPLTAQQIPRAEFELISRYDTMPTREDLKAKPEAEKANCPETPDSSTCKKTLQVLATAYCGCSECCGKSDHITATGTRATEGRTIAVDPRMIPYGTHVLINGHEYVAEDCGGDIQNSRVDIYFERHEAARIWGKQYVTLEVIE